MAERGFRYAVILAGMRTGSNLLEESLGSFQGVSTHGELFNPHFFGRPGEMAQFGLSLAARASDPARVLEEMCRVGDGFPVFRLFEDHDPRILGEVLSDHSAAKIVLRRPALESWVSLKIARKTGQWWLGDERRAQEVRVSFDERDYTDFARRRANFYHGIGRRLRRSGQTAFELSYDDLFDAETVAGLGRWLGLGEVKRGHRVKARVQNPTPLADRLIEPEAVARTLAKLTSPDLSALREYEPPRGPGLRGFVAVEGLPILYTPIRGALTDPVADWLEGQRGAGDPILDMNQKRLRAWQREHPGHRSFTILRHPLRRAWDAFARFIMPADGFVDIRDLLVRRHDMPVPEEGWSTKETRRAFTVFLRFLQANLAGQTSVRVDASWTSQSRHLAGIAAASVPDVIMREESLSGDVARLGAALSLDLQGAPVFAPVGAIRLEDVVTPKIEELCARAYRRDMLRFGFGKFMPQAA